MDVRAKEVIRSLHLLYSKPVFIQSDITSLLTTNVLCHLEDPRQALPTLRRLVGELALSCEVASIQNKNKGKKGREHLLKTPQWK